MRAIDILPDDWQSPVDSTWSILLLMTWWHKEPGHLQWATSTIIISLKSTYWGQVICISKLTIIGADNGLEYTGILLIRPLRTNFSEILSEIHTFSFNKMHLKMSSAKRRPVCLSLNVLTILDVNHPKPKFGHHCVCRWCLAICRHSGD